MKQRPFGRTGVDVSEVGFGAWAIGGHGPGVVGYGPSDDATSLAALHLAVERGVTFVDTASVYGRGHSEELIARAGIREKVFLATKAGFDWSGGEHRKNWDRAFLLRSVDESLRRLKTDRVDLLQLHNPPVADMGAVEVLHEVKKAGKARFVGVSIHTPEEAQAAMERGAETVQLIYNYHQQQHRIRTFPEAAARGVAIIVREPLERGLLTGKFKRGHRFPAEDVRSAWKPEDFSRRMDSVEEFLSIVKPGLSPARAALKFVLSSPEVGVVIPGLRTPAQVEENTAASDGNYRLVGDVFENEDVEAGFGGDA